MKAKLLFSLLLICCGLGAIELPIYAQWQARHYIYYDTLQKGKELSWDELYRAEIGIEQARWKDWALSFALESEEFFNEALVKLKSFNLGYQLPDERFTLGAGTKLHGYGSGSAIDTLPVLERGYIPYRFQPRRMNAVALGFEYNPASLWELKAGGNKHNQASMLLSYQHQKDKGHYAFSLDARAMDNHWRTPVLIPAFEYYDNWKQVSWDMSVATALFPEWEATERHNDYFALGELRYNAERLPDMGIAAAYKKQNYAPFEEHEYRVYLAQELGAFRFTPIASLQEVDKERLWKYTFLSQYKLLNNSTFGAYYEYSHFETNKPRHTLGLAVDLKFEPAK